MFRTIEHYEETSLGLPYPIVLLDSAEEEVDEATGEVVGISVPDLEQLVCSVVIARALMPVQLSGAELRFIREVLGVGSAAFAEAVCMNPATYSRWENGKAECGEWADKQVRMIAVLKLRDRVPNLSLDPAMVADLRIRKAVPGEWPRITMRRVPVEQPCGHSGPEKEAWDALPLAA